MEDPKQWRDNRAEVEAKKETASGEKPFYLEIDRNNFLNLAEKYRLAIFNHQEIEALDEPQKTCMESFRRGGLTIMHQEPKDFGAISHGMGEIMQELLPHLDDSDKKYEQDLVIEMEGIFGTIAFTDKEETKATSREFFGDFQIEDSSNIPKEDFYYAGMAAALLDVPARFVAFSNKYEDFFSALREKNYSAEVERIIEKRPDLSVQARSMSNHGIHLYRELHLPSTIIKAATENIANFAVNFQDAAVRFSNVGWLVDNFAKSAELVEQLKENLSRINEAYYDGTAKLPKPPQIIAENQGNPLFPEEDLKKIIPLLLASLKEACLQCFISELATDKEDTVLVRFNSDSEIEINFSDVEIPGLGLDRIDRHYGKSEATLLDEVCEVTDPWKLRIEKGKIFIEKSK